jgi:PAT family beta-lactamase induction signal transducer AmpG
MTRSATEPSILSRILSRRMLSSFMMGFSCGLPLLLTLSVLQAWMKDEGIDLTVIGLINIVGLPYTLKFLWAPLMDRYSVPFLGRRRGWMLMAQVFLMTAIFCLGMTSPSKHPLVLVICAFLVTFSSASQDIVVDAYRREDLPNEELGLGSSFYTYGYRIGMLLASGGGLILSDHIPFSAVYAIMAACMLPGIITTLLTPEPSSGFGMPGTLREAVIEPLVDYFNRKHALWILAFILFYKIGDTMAGAITTPFYMDMGFSKTEIGAIVKLFGFWSVLLGLAAGGLLLLKLGISKCLWIFGILQALSTAGFAVLAKIGYHTGVLSGVIAFENFTGGMGTSAFLAFMASITNKKFTATQYALLSSLMGIPRVLISAPTGFMAKEMGWEPFFIFCTVIAIPGLLMLGIFAPWKGQPEGA